MLWFKGWCWAGGFEVAVWGWCMVWYMAVLWAYNHPRPGKRLRTSFWQPSGPCSDPQRQSQLDPWNEGMVQGCGVWCANAFQGGYVQTWSHQATFSPVFWVNHWGWFVRVCFTLPKKRDYFLWFIWLVHIRHLPKFPILAGPSRWLKNFGKLLVLECGGFWHNITPLFFGITFNTTDKQNHVHMHTSWYT